MYDPHRESAQLRTGLSSDNPPQVKPLALFARQVATSAAGPKSDETAKGSSSTSYWASPWHPAEQLRAAGEVVRALVEQVEGLHKQVLPAFELPADALPAAGGPGAPAVDDPRPSASGDGLFRQVQRLEQALGLLHMIVDAKSQTMSIARDRLQEENSELRSQLETREASGIPEVVVPEVVDAAQWRQEKRMLRHEMAALQKLYDEELVKLRASKEDEGQAAVQTTSDADNVGPDMPEVGQGNPCGSQSREEVHEAALLQVGGVL
ncbi:hypothetical protein CYMTET_54867 [Cymbomonas tetramitiformis]|uniref:Uncharacterized protein n=1 Tax=Cymbomonas tetramitiformis TaxID=36881 RepID=A0AAE0BF99_9CHLO|nr:hypothetical protein CYMTET_54867 [Cymbomonas tetramitiformis]